MAMRLAEQIEVMQHYLAGGRIEYRVKPESRKHGPKIWTTVISQPDTGSFAFDWENEEIRIYTAPREFELYHNRDTGALYNRKSFGDGFINASQWETITVVEKKN